MTTDRNNLTRSAEAGFEPDFSNFLPRVSIFAAKFRAFLGRE